MWLCDTEPLLGLACKASTARVLCDWLGVQYMQVPRWRGFRFEVDSRVGVLVLVGAAEDEDEMITSTRHRRRNSLGLRIS
jgi:hypothetical protein